MPETLLEARGVRIGGQAAAPISPERFEVIEAATGKAMASVEGGGVEDARRAVQEASTAFEEWSRSSPAERAHALRQIAVVLDDAADGSLAEVVSRETGKRLPEARAEIRFSARYFEWFADVLGTSHEQLWNVVPGVRHLVRWRPRGVVAVMTPWNFPVSIPARKIAPALAAGCTVVLRPSQYAPLSTLALAEAAEPFLPAGALNTVCGNARKVADVWIEAPRVAGLTFTGSTEVGRKLAAEAGRRLKPVTLELGGRAPFVVCADADVDDATEALMIAKFRNNGESCIAANNVWVHRNLWNSFVDSYTARVKEMRLGNPATDDIDLGPVRKKDDVSRLGAMVEEAEDGGAEVVVGGDRSPPEGFYFRPAICLNPPTSASVWRKEVFGPVTPIRPFDSFDEVVEDTNSSSYGLAGYVISNDEGRALNLVARLDVGLVGINLATPNTPQIPVGGMKASGYGGYEGGWAGLEPFLEYQSVALRNHG